MSGWCGVSLIPWLFLDWRSRSLGIVRSCGEPVLLVCHHSLWCSWFFYPLFWLGLIWLCLGQIGPWSQITCYRNMITIADFKQPINNCRILMDIEFVFHAGETYHTGWLIEMACIKRRLGLMAYVTVMWALIRMVRNDLEEQGLV